MDKRKNNEYRTVPCADIHATASTFTGLTAKNNAVIPVITILEVNKKIITKTKKVFTK